MTDKTHEPSTTVSRKTVAKLLMAACAVYLLYLTSKVYTLVQATKDAATAAKDVRHVVASEELILQLTPKLKLLSQSMLNLQVPEHQSVQLFATDVDVHDLDGNQDAHFESRIPGVSMQAATWPIEPDSTTKNRNGLALWRPLLDTTAFFENAKFYIIDGRFTNDELGEFDANVGFSGLAFTKHGKWRAIHSRQTVRWQRTTDTSTEQDDWQITSWRTRDLATEDCDQRLFDEVLDQVLPDERERRRAQESIHETLLTPFLLEQKLPVEYYTPYFAPDSLSQHPSLSVVDIDQDGFDDLYVMARWGKNLLLQNQRDGTFRENAAVWGLDIDGRSTSAVFADFDNDGDPDLLLGRSLERSMYLVNEDGNFVDRSQDLVSGDLPYLVTSVSSADFNGDGLLDIYLCTYSASLLTERLFQDDTGGDSKAWPDEFLTKSQATKLRTLTKTAHRILNQVGPPNVLLVNRGNGHFETAPDDHPLALWRSTLQATWADYDQDGDPDLYVANDFAPGNLFRNNGTQGFVDVSDVMNAANMGAGMGASWGDYDNDGKQDVYISNMYSKAGLRITAQVPNIDQRFVRFAEGNMMFRNLGDNFDNVAGLEPPALMVAKAGWSWGGQFVDIDNDCDLDIYVCSGYYTVPEELASEVDL